jgi:hypothetical protein
MPNAECRMPNAECRSAGTDYTDEFAIGREEDLASDPVPVY